MTAERPDYYEVLGVPPTATDEEIHRAYLVLLRRFHPDLAGQDRAERAAAEEQTKTINEAYTALSEHRAEYDRTLAAERAAQSSLQEELRRFGGFAGGDASGAWADLLRRREEAMAQAMRRGADDERAWRDAAQTRLFAQLFTVLSQPMPGRDFYLELGLTQRAWRRGVPIRAPFDGARIDLPAGIAPGRYTVRGHGRWGLNGGSRGDLHLVVRHVTDDGTVLVDGFDGGSDGAAASAARTPEEAAEPLSGAVIDGPGPRPRPAVRRGHSPLAKALVLLLILVLLVMVFG